MIAVHLKSALYGMQTVLPHVQFRGRGQVIQVSTFLSRVPLATYRFAYSAAEAGLNILTANARMDVQRMYPDIHSCQVLPGVVETDFAHNALGERQRPRPADVYTNPANPGMVQGYIQDVRAFEARLG